MAGIFLNLNSFNNRYLRNSDDSAKERYEAKKRALIEKNYNHIYNHELAHKIAGGSLAGDIVIERNSEGIPFAGHVSIKMPTLNEKNPQQTINDANTVIRSAMAPSDPSEQDYKVADQARNIKAQAENAMSKKRLNVVV